MQGSYAILDQLTRTKSIDAAYGPSVPHWHRDENVPSREKKLCRLTPAALDDHLATYNDPKMRGSLDWHMASRALLAAGAISLETFEGNLLPATKAIEKDRSRHSVSSENKRESLYR